MLNNIKDAHMSLIIPVYNEERILKGTLRDVELYLTRDAPSLEIVIVNDGSEDGSLRMIEDRFRERENIKIISNIRRKGKALSIYDGIKAATGEYILFMDADMSVSLREIDKILKYSRQGNDVIIGVRNEKDKDTLIVRPMYRRIISKIYNRVCSILFFKNRISDVGCGFKAFKREIAQSLFSDLYIKSWVFDVEILLRALRRKYKIKEVSVNWTFKGHSHLNIYKDLMVSCCDLLRFKLLLIKEAIYENRNGGVEFLSEGRR